MHMNDDRNITYIGRGRVYLFPMMKRKDRKEWTLQNECVNLIGESSGKKQMVKILMAYMYRFEDQTLTTKGKVFNFSNS